MAESAMPTSMPGSFTPSRPSVPPKAITIGNVTGSSQTAGRPELRAPEPDRDHREDVVEARDRMREPGEESGRLAARACARRRCRRAGATRQQSRERRSADAGPSRSTEQDRRALDRPERAERADRVAGQRLDPARPADLERRNDALEREDEQHEADLADLDADVEAEQRERQVLRGRPALVSALAKPKPWMRPKTNATTQGWRIVKLVWPRHERTISGPRKKIESAIAALSGRTGASA